MKDESPLQPESQNQNTENESTNVFSSTEKTFNEPGVSNEVPSNLFASGEIEPSTSEIASGNTPSSTQSSFSAETETPSIDAPFNNQPSEPETPTEASFPATTNEVPPIPVAPVVPVPVSPVPPTPPKNGKRKKIIIFGAVIGLLALLGVGSAAAYNLWYQNPDKVLGDALVNAVKSKTVTYTGSFDLDYKSSGGFSSTETDDLKLNVKVDGKNTRSEGEVVIALTANYQNKDYKVSGAGLIDKDANLFLKVNDVKKLLQSLPSESGVTYEELPTYFTAIIDKVDSKWIRISADDIKEFSDEYSKTQSCVENVFKKLEDDKEFSDELLDVYSENKFIVIDEKLPAKNGSLGYVVDIDDDKTEDFAKAADKTKFAKELQKCDEDFKFSSSSNSSSGSDSDAETRVELWVDRWSHQLTKASLSVTDKEADGEFVIEPKFNQVITVEAPKDFISLKELKADIENAYTQYMSDLMGGSSSLYESTSINNDTGMGRTL